jgi:hypothetical protein
MNKTILENIHALDIKKEHLENELKKLNGVKPNPLDRSINLKQVILDKIEILIELIKTIKMKIYYLKGIK